MVGKLHPIAAQFNQALLDAEVAHSAEVKDLTEKLAHTINQLTAQARSAKRAEVSLKRQRDASKGAAAEYRGYALKYQRELLAARAEIKQLLKAAQ